MLLTAYSVFDCKPEVFHPPFMAHNVRDAIRRFHRLLTEAPNFKGYEEDYSLYEVGQFDDKAGVLVPPENGHKKFIIQATACLGHEKVDLATAKAEDIRDHGGE
jgi:hypothetical protein